MLYKINPSRYPDFIAAADAHNCGKVYPLSVAEGIQEGDIFTGSINNYDNVLFWTYCGFAYLSGKADDCFLEDVYELMTDRTDADRRRFLLMTKDTHIQEYFKSKDDVIAEKRYLFGYSKNRGTVGTVLPVGYELKEIDDRLSEQISGKITPALFWKNVNDFTEKGKGYCLICNNEIAAWAFSAAVSGREIDIGIETNPKYRQQGLGLIVAQKMIQYAIEREKEPVWACHCKNTASERMAGKLGFEKISECFVVKCKY